MASSQGRIPRWPSRSAKTPTQSIPLVVLLLKEDTPERHEYKAILPSTSNFIPRLRDIFQDEPTRDLILLRLNRVLRRLQRVFETMKAADLHRDIPENLFQGLVSPLIDPHAEILSLDQTLHLAGSAIPALVKKPSAFLHHVADAFLAVDGLLERLLAHEAYSTALKEWLSSNRNHLDTPQVMTIIEKVISMCDTCPADHDIAALSEKWHMARSLMESLDALLKSSEEDEKKKIKLTKNLPRLSDMKVLSGNDKKENRGRSNTQTGFEVPPEIAEKMASLNLQKPTSSRTLVSTLENLENDAPSFMLTALESFPCRPCWEVLTGTLTIQTHPSIPSGSSAQPETKYDIFGKRVGSWKLLLSDRALKTSRKLARTGTFGRVEQKLRQLASGEWKGKDLSNRAGTKKQIHDMEIPVLRAPISQNLFLLWQIDVGFYDDIPRVRQHIVKVWCIVTEDETSNAVDQVIALQKSYAPEDIQLSSQRPIQQADGRFLPKRFDNAQTAQAHSGLVPATLKTSNQVLIEMSNKFYNLTGPFLKSMFLSTGREEFPFDLSPEEIDIVSHFNTSSLILGRSGTGKTTCLVFKILAKYRARKSIPGERPVRQPLLTRSSFLASKLQAYARSLINTQFQNFSTDAGTGVFPDEQSPDVPVSLFSMEDSRFPFVCTYDDFLGILDSTIKRADRKTFFPDTSDRAFVKGNEISQVGLLGTRGQKFIDFNVFKIEYWGCLSGIVPSCSPELLFSEIMGVIKGSSSSAEALECLSRVQYVGRSGKLSPAFATEAERDRVYSAFERYEKLKKQRGELDELDRVIGLLRVLKGNPALEQLIRQCFEEIYVDEVQDLRCLDIVLLLSCVCDARGIHLAGGTAQCISKDSVFRFPEIKPLFYGYYDSISDQISQPELARPRQFALSKNYRSHQGILSLASFVMQMLWTGFPDTIDKLDPEIGHTSGPTPVVFAGFDSSILPAKMIGLVKLNDRVGDFGAEQVILVRDDVSKDKLQKQIGEIALVLTILESKGMEFDDVLAYDFFSGSDIGSSHRCLRLLARGEKKQFDSQKHAAVCSELKHLYVAITRARNQLWFVESSENNVKPVLEALSENEGHQLVDPVRQNDPDVAEKVKVLRAGGSVDPERWLKRGAHLFHQKNFADALFCFKKANDEQGITQCQAWLHEQQGRVCPASGDLHGLQENYGKAIELFLQINLVSEAVCCLESFEEYERIARLWKECGQLGKAALYFEKGRLFYDSSECYHLTGNFEEAVDVLRRGDQFDHLINYISSNRDSLSSTTRHKYARLCNVLLKQGRVSPDLRAKTIDLLGSDADKEAFFKEFEMTDHLRSFYTSRRRYRELFDLCLTAGDLCSALHLVISRKLIRASAENVEKLLNYVVVEALFSRKGLIDERSERDHVPLKAFTSPLLERLVSPWKPIFHLLDSIDDEGSSIDLLQLEDGLAKDLFCFFAVAFGEKIVVRSSMASLPIDFLWRTVKLLVDLTAEGSPSSKLLFLLFGMYEVPTLSRKTILLPWSPLRPLMAGEIGFLSPEELFKQVRRWILDKFSEVISAFSETATRLCLQEYKPDVFISLSEEVVPDNEQTNANSPMRESTSTIALTKLPLSPLYYRRIMNEEFSGQFLRRKRHWLERLIEEITFAASTDQAAISIHTAKLHILKDPNFSALSCSLEELLFHRLGREWQARQSLSVILEQVQLAQFLGFQTSARFFRALGRKVHYTLKYAGGSTSLKIAFGAVRSADHIRMAAAWHNPYELVAGVRGFLEAIEKSSPKSLSAFEALVSVFEYAATFLLCVVSPGSAVAIPWSWAVFHFPGILQAQQAKVNVAEQEKLVYMSCLIHLTSGFCKVVDRLEWEVRFRGMGLDCAGRRNLPPVIIRRRNADVLAAIALNMAHWPIAPRGFSELWTQIQKPLSSWAPPGFPTQINTRILHNDIIRSFDIYGGKDAMCVVSLDNSETPPVHLKSFVTGGAQFVKLNYLLEVTHGVADMVTPGDGKGNRTGDVAEYTRVEQALIVGLQQRWRRVLSRIRDQRRLRETPEGTMLLNLQNLCSTTLSVGPALSSLSSAKKVAVRAFVFTYCHSILVELDRTAAAIQRLREMVKQKFDKGASTSLAELEELAVIPGQLQHFETKLTNLVDSWSLRGLDESLRQLIPVEEMKLRAYDARRALRTIQQESQIIEEKLSD